VVGVGVDLAWDLPPGAIIGGAIAASTPYYGYGYGYPAYSYGYGYGYPAYSYGYYAPTYYAPGYTYAYPRYRSRVYVALSALGLLVNHIS
jgi:hypothetical protein